MAHRGEKVVRNQEGQHQQRVRDGRGDEGRVGFRDEPLDPAVRGPVQGVMVVLQPRSRLVRAFVVHGIHRGVPV